MSSRTTLLGALTYISARYGHSREEHALGQGAIQVLRNAMGSVKFPDKKRYECALINVFKHYKGVGGFLISRKKRYETIEWPQNWVKRYI